jgi:radical SAM superfamily enzyme YgiQ (UPF0313 family)
MSWNYIKENRRLLADEAGAIVKDPGGKTTVALVYPNSYRVGMSNLAVHTVYKLLNDHPGMACERAFLPIGDGPVLTIETQRSIAEFDIVAFTISFENDLLNVIPILERSKIPHRKANRTGDHPIVIAGGAAVTLNPHPLEHIVDTCVRGEFEAYGDDLSSQLAACHSEGGTTEESLAFLSQKARDPSPAAQDDKINLVADLDRFPTQTVIHTPNTTFGDMHLIEVMRGCPRNCTFCATPGLYSPFRMRSFDAVMAMVDEGSRYRRKFGLIGSDIASHPRFKDIARAILDRGYTFSLSSVRVDRIDAEVAALLKQSGMRSISLGIEGATERLRKTLEKGFTDERCMRSVALLAAEGITNVRLYYMIGLPDETEADIDAIPVFAETVLQTIRDNAPKTRRTSSVECTIAPFVPKPLSPFKDKAFAGIKRINEIQKRLKKLAGKRKGIKLSFDSAQHAAIEAYLAKAGPEAIEFLEEVMRTSPRKALLTI